MSKKIIIFSLFLVLIVVLGLLVWARPWGLSLKHGSCSVLEEKYCKAAEIFDWNSPSGRTYKAVGFRLPVGTTVFSPLDGDLGLVQASAFGRDVRGVDVTSRPDGLSFAAHGALRSDLSSGTKVNKGEPLAFVEGKDVGMPNSYNVVLLFIKEENGQMVTDEQMFEKFNK